MKNFVKTLTVVFLSVVICVSFIACAKTTRPNGTYSDNIGFSQLTFKRNNVEMVHIGYGSLEMDETTKQEGKYEIDGDTVNISWDDGGSDSYTYDEEKDELVMGPVVFTKDNK